MTSRDLRSSLSSENVAEFLADREKVVGRARQQFLHLLREYGSFRQSSRPRRTRTLVAISLAIALAGYAIEHTPNWADRLVWPGGVLLAIVPIWRVHREESQSPHTDLETDWHAYCLFLRPVILIEYPGLLDRNKNSTRREAATKKLLPLPVLRNLVRERGSDFWWSALLGLWCGMLTLVVAHLAAVATNWLLAFAFPVGGMVLGPGIWTIWQRIIYRIAISDSRRTDS